MFQQIHIKEIHTSALIGEEDFSVFQARDGGEWTRAVAGEMARQDTSVRAPRLYARENHSTKKRKNEQKIKQNIGESPEIDMERGQGDLGTGQEQGQELPDHQSDTPRVREL